MGQTETSRLTKRMRRRKNMEIKLDEIRPFTEMSSKELFVILTGGEGIMEQTILRNIIHEYLMKYGDTADLVTMVHKMAEEE